MTAIPVSERRKWVGASEVAAILGVSSFLSKFELWHLKAGNLPPTDLAGNERVDAGRHFEAGIAAWASERWNWPLRFVSEYTPHPTVSGFGASLDFEAIDGLSPVEMKWVDGSIFRKNWAADADSLIDAPLEYLVQVQAQLACRQRESGWLVACAGGNKLYRMEIQRHPRLIAKIEAEVYAFWASIANNEPPRPDFEMDAETIGALYGGAGADFADLRHNERARDLCVQYRQGVEVEKAGAALKSQSLAELKMMMQDARGAIVDDGYTVKASHIKETTIARSAHWRFSVTQQKSAQGAQEKEPT